MEQLDYNLHSGPEWPSTTYFRVIVAQELKAGCHTPVARERVEAFLRPFRRTGRLVTPTFADWEGTGDLLARILKERPELRDKLPHLIAALFSTLALRSASEVQAVVRSATP